MGSVSWETSAAKRVRVHALDGSYPARRASAVLKEANRAVAVLEALLSPPTPARHLPLEIYLTDAVVDAGDGGQGGVDGDAIVLVVLPEAPGEPVVYPITRVLVRRWFGSRAASASLFVNGLAGVAADQVQEADDVVRNALRSGRAPSVFAPDSEDVATSFVGFLVKAFGSEPLGEFLAAYDPERRDQAAVAAFQRPLAALEELWLESLRTVSGARATFAALFGHLVPLVRPEWRRWLEILAYIAAGVAYTIAIPLAFKYLFDTIIPNRSLGRLGVFVAILFAVFVGNALVTVRRSYVTGLVNQRVLFGLQERMYERLQRLSHDFYGRAKVGDLMARLSNDLNTVQDATTAVLVQGAFLLLGAFAAAITALVLSPLLGALVLVVVPVFVLSYRMLLSRIRESSREVQTIYGQVAATMQENLSAHPVVKALGLEDRAVAAYRGRLGGLLRTISRLYLLSAAFEASVGMAVALGQLLVIGVGGWLVIEGRLTVGTLVAFVGLLPTFFQPVTALADVGRQVQGAAGAIDRMVELLEEPITVAERAGAKPLDPLSREIRFDRVAFGYGPDRTILGDLDLTIAAGGHVAIVGASGSGKSTIVNLLVRFWDPQEGRVMFDGRDVRDVTLASLRGQIGLVFQDTFVFDTTLRDNVALAREGATDADVEAAVAAAELDDWTRSLPAGLDTLLGERGVRMSGGQRQRLAIARALIRDPSVLILDEATSALDAKTEAEILETLDELAEGRTTISITHRLSLSARADHVVVLDEGRIVEEGTHLELVSAGGLYEQLYEEQMAHIGAGLEPLGIEVARLRTIPLFSALGRDELSRLARHLKHEQYRAGVEIVRQGDDGRRLCFVASGQAEVTVAGEEGGRRINVLNDGDFFGEMALLTGEPRAATVRTTMPTEVYSLSRREFLALLERDPGLRRAVVETIAVRRRALAEATGAAHRGEVQGAPLTGAS